MRATFMLGAAFSLALLLSPLPALAQAHRFDMGSPSAPAVTGFAAGLAMLLALTRRRRERR